MIERNSSRNVIIFIHWNPQKKKRNNNNLNGEKKNDEKLWCQCQHTYVSSNICHQLITVFFFPFFCFFYLFYSCLCCVRKRINFYLFLFIENNFIALFQLMSFYWILSNRAYSTHSHTQNKFFLCKIVLLFCFWYKYCQPIFI